MSTIGHVKVLADSGPFAALFNARDSYHHQALRYFEKSAPKLRFLTTWEVVSEVMYFLDFSANAQADFLQWLHTCHAKGLMEIAGLTPDDLPGLSTMLRKYADRPMDLADASLVWLANATGVTDIITIDRADFAVYRTAKRKAFKNVFV
jgi:predicted nucleic acid-binding protein